MATDKPDDEGNRAGTGIGGVALAALLIALAALPVLVARYPQMTDYPAHLARYHVMLHLPSHPDLARHYAFAWQWGGNLGVDILMLALGPLLGVETAGRVVAGLIPALTCAAILLVEWVLRRRIGAGALLALAAIWSPSLVLGFLNYTLSIALALLSFAMPRHLGGGDFADYRLTAVALMVGCMAIDWQLPRAGLMLCAAPFLIRTLTISADWHDRSARSEQALGALDHLPRGARVVAAVTWPVSGWKPQAWSHAACYATVRRDAVTNSDFAIPGLHMLRLRQPGAFSDPSQMVEQPFGISPDLADFAPARDADYLWYFGAEEPARLPAGATVVFRTPESQLVRLAGAAVPR